MREGMMRDVKLEATCEAIDTTPPGAKWATYRPGRSRYYVRLRVPERIYKLLLRYELWRWA